jgi:hypothetical protein
MINIADVINDLRYLLGHSDTDEADRLLEVNHPELFREEM